MRNRLVPLALITALTLVPTLTACSGGSGKITLSDSAATATTAAPEDAAPEDAAAPDETLGTIPDVATDLIACTELAEAMSAMAMSAIGSEISPETEARVEKIRGGLPDDVRTDLDTLVDAYKKLGASGDLSEAAGAVNDPEFAAANERLSAYFQTACAGEG